MTYKTVTPEIHDTVSSMSAIMRRLNSAFVASYVTPASIDQAKSLSKELDAANRYFRKSVRHLSRKTPVFKGE